jgi:hypothetical protein
MKRFLTTLAVLTAIATPALAQHARQDLSTGLPGCCSSERPAQKRSASERAFAMVPRAPAASSLDDPSLTGGGSTGYNEMSRSY